MLSREFSADLQFLRDDAAPAKMDPFEVGTLANGEAIPVRAETEQFRRLFPADQPLHMAIQGPRAGDAS